MTLVHKERMRRGKADANAARYEDDAYTWALQQAALLRRKQTEGLDWINLADEITDVANAEYDKLQAALLVVVQHVLKWDYQPERRSRSWALSIREHRRRVERSLRRHAGLGSRVEEALSEAYADARDRALAETRLSEATVPTTSPYSFEQVMTREIVWPED